VSAAFNIGSQQAGAIYQAAGNQTIHHGGGTLSVDALDAAADLRTALEATELPASLRHEADHALEALETELQAPEPDKGAIGAGVERVVGILGQAGALASAGEGLVGPLRAIASFAGVAGAAALRLLV
jgi:hypothetical protein